MSMFKKQIIYGCEDSDEAGTPYLTRWRLVHTKLFGVYLHRFHRSDGPEHHDHPWAFCSVILWRGYMEETVCPRCKGSGKSFVRSFAPAGLAVGMSSLVCMSCFGDGTVVERIKPGRVLFRKATHRHRVLLATGTDGKPVEAWTLIIRGAYCRDWGFFTKDGWEHFKAYFARRGC